MNSPGWYDDPGGSGGKRYWDGARWTHHLNPPGRTSTGAPPSRSRPSGVFLALAAAIVVGALVALTGVLVVVRPWDRLNEIADNVAGQSVGSTTPDSPSTSGNPSALPSGVPGEDWSAECDAPKVSQLPPPVDDGRVHGGPLSYPTSDLPGWEGPVSDGQIPFGRDSYQMYTRIDTEIRPWASSARVGVADFEQYPGHRQATQDILACVLTSSLYTGLQVEPTEVVATAMSISDHQGTLLTATLRIDDPSLNTKGSRIWTAVFDTETDPVFFFAAAPMENSEHIALITQVVNDLAIN